MENQLPTRIRGKSMCGYGGTQLMFTVATHLELGLDARVLSLFVSVHEIHIAPNR